MMSLLACMTMRASWQAHSGLVHQSSYFLRCMWTYLFLNQCGNKDFNSAVLLKRLQTARMTSKRSIRGEEAHFCQFQNRAGMSLHFCPCALSCHFGVTCLSLISGGTTALIRVLHTQIQRNIHGQYRAIHTYILMSLRVHIYPQTIGHFLKCC